MGKFEGVLIASDYDGTLIDDNYKIHEKNRRAVEYFITNGGLFSLATGRARQVFRVHALRFPHNAPSITTNGGAIYDYRTDNLIYEICLPERAADDLRLITGKFPEAALEIYSPDGVYMYNPNEITRRHLEMLEASASEITDAGGAPSPWGKVLFEHERSYLLGIQKFILDNWGGHYEAVTSSPYLLELTAKGIHKGAAIERLAAHLGVDMRHFYCIGDNHNDLPMLELSAIPFAPANAVDAVKRLPGIRVMSGCDEHCVSDMIDVLDSIY